MSSWVITGGSAGIGASIIQYLIKNSNDNQNIIFTVSRRPLMLDSIPAEIRIVLSSHITCFHAGTTKVFHLQGDLTQRNILEKLKDLILHNTRKIDSLLLNAATVTPLGPLSTLEMSDFRRY